MDARPVAVVSGVAGSCGGAVVGALATHFTVWLACHDDFETHQADSFGVPRGRCWWIDRDDRPPGMTKVCALVHCAAPAVAGSVAGTPVEQWTDVFRRDIFTVAAVTRRLLPALRREHGHVIIERPVSPERSVVGRASASAMRMFAEALRAEERASGVRVTEIDAAVYGSGTPWPACLSAAVATVSAFSASSQHRS
ncbi:hypothetical protein [Amycolatopsis sp. GM8]|uniref:hypothetical protein n=1 Tax=Amycolatopsis sp. GM8 TaxID=2896530 RepID=UPI001F3DCA6B|nr:hypothetical protein [Amycolatopsis sp. GM8]